MSRVVEFELFEFDATTLTANLQDFGTPVANPVIILSFFNTSDVDVYVSADQFNNTWRLPAVSSLTLDSRDISDNNNDSTYLLRKLTQLQVRQVTGAGTDGNIILHITCQSLP